jgi:type II secretory pathway pseudopilin PulG
LIEVLIGIMVLALGLVGLAAVFPTVVRQQQVAADQSNGLSVSKSAIAALKQQADLARPLSDAGYLDVNDNDLTIDSPEFPLNSLNLVGWSVLTWDATWSIDGAWQRPSPVASASANGGLNLDPLTGTLVVGRQRPGVFAPVVRHDQNGQPHQVLDPRNIPLGGATIELRDRLFPMPLPGVKDVAQPRFVWDVVVRRLDEGEKHTSVAYNAGSMRSYRDDGVQIVIFVRRIDPGIRVPAGQELSDLLAPVGTNPTRLPVAADATGVPTLDGALNYSTIQPLTFDLVIAPAVRYDEIDLTGPAAMLPYAAQIGQQLVDQLGEVHRVVEVLEPVNAGTRRVRLDTPMRSDYSVVAPQPSGSMELIFSPQIPASVEVVSVAPARAAKK